MLPLISIIVPVYNTDQYLDKCLNSLRRQTYTNLEIILVDNGSTDGSAAICDKHAAEDKRIKAIHTDNIGAPRAINMGLDDAKGDFIAIVDGDDWLEPDMYQYLYDNMQAYNADVSVCGYYRDENGKQSVNHRLQKPIVCDRDMAMELIIRDKVLQSFCWNKLYKRYIFGDLRFPQAWDLVFTYQALWRAKRTVLLPEPKYHYVVRNTSIVMQKSAAMHVRFFRSANMQLSGLIELGYPLAARYLVRRGLHTINGLIKAEGNNEDIQHILNTLKPYHKTVGILQLGPAYRRRWWMMEHCLEIYKKLYLFMHRK